MKPPWFQRMSSASRLYFRGSSNRLALFHVKHDYGLFGFLTAIYTRCFT